MKKFIARSKSSLVVYLFFISVIFGLVYFLLHKPDLNTYITSFIDSIINSKQNIILFNIGAISILFLSSITIFPLPLIYLYIFTEGFSIGFTFGLFILSRGVNGFIFYFLFIIICKLVYLIILLYFVIMCSKYVRNILINIIKKNREGIYKSIINNFYRYIIVLIIVIINSLFIYFYSNKILLHLIYLIK